MATTPKLLANGQVSDTQGAIGSPSGVTWMIPPGCVNLTNTNTTTENVILYIKDSGGTARVYRNLELVADGGWFSDALIVLETGDTLEAVTDTASVVDYVIFGGEYATV